MGYIDVIKDMYKGAAMNVRTTCGKIDEFPMTIDLHQGVALSPYLFAHIMDQLIAHMKKKVPCRL